ncbi:MAG: argininosuccinate synthase [Planctomycetota bacterium]|jgi:argininosuccinate synthase
MSKRKIVVAFSGGLDTSFCVVWLRQEQEAEVHTVLAIEARATECGAASHTTIDGRAQIFDRFISYLVKGNVLRGGVYPLCVGAERVVQGEEMVRIAKAVGADAVCHGSTGAGNDQVRFDVTFRVLAPELELMSPVRDLKWSREQEAEYLRAAGIDVDASTATYSVNAGMWGTTVGGGEIHDPAKEPSEAAWAAAGSSVSDTGSREVTVGFAEGVPVAVDGAALDGTALCAKLDALAAPFGIGRGVHLGDTILGIKGRIAFVAPAAAILLPAHRELEKLVCTSPQLFWKDQLATWWGDNLHVANYFEPAMRDVEALIDSSQRRVTGEVRLRLRPGAVDVLGVSAAQSLDAPEVATYGEEPRAFTGEDAKGMARVKSIPAMLWRRAGDAPKS